MGIGGELPRTNRASAYQEFAGKIDSAGIGAASPRGMRKAGRGPRAVVGMAPKRAAMAGAPGRCFETGWTPSLVERGQEPNG